MRLINKMIRVMAKAAGMCYLANKSHSRSTEKRQNSQLKEHSISKLGNILQEKYLKALFKSLFSSHFISIV